MNNLMSFKGMILDFSEDMSGLHAIATHFKRHYENVIGTNNNSPFPIDKLKARITKIMSEKLIKESICTEYGISDITDNPDAVIEYQSAIAALSEEQEMLEYLDEDIEVFPVFSNGNIVSAPLYFEDLTRTTRYNFSQISKVQGMCPDDGIIRGVKPGNLIVRYFVNIRKLNPAFGKRRAMIEVLRVLQHNTPPAPPELLHYVDRLGTTYDKYLATMTEIDEQGNRKLFLTVEDIGQVVYDKEGVPIGCDPSFQKRKIIGERYVQPMNTITNETKWYNVPDDMELKLGDSIDLTRIGPPLNHMPLGGQIATIV